MPSADLLRTSKTRASELVPAGQLISDGARRGSKRCNRISSRADAVGERSKEPVEMRSGTKNVRRGAAGWRCIACGGLITRIEDGWVEWLAAEDSRGTTTLKGLRLVHGPVGRSGAPGECGCRYDGRREFRNDRSIAEGLPLERFVGADGLMLLLAFLAADELPRNDVLELAKRVQIPGYEQTRELFQDAIAREAITPMIRDQYYLQSEIQALLRWAASGIRSWEESIP
jgi:hypothetical protein